MGGLLCSALSTGRDVPRASHARLTHSTHMAIGDVTIGELFPASDEVAQWVFSLSVVVDDLHHITRLQTAEVGSGGDARTMLLLQRVLTIRLYEARKLVYSVDLRPTIAEFLHTGNVFLEQLRAHYLPIGDSMVDRLYGALRHHSVHYM